MYMTPARLLPALASLFLLACAIAVSCAPSGTEAAGCPMGFDRLRAAPSEAELFAEAEEAEFDMVQEQDVYTEGENDSQLLAADEEQEAAAVETNVNEEENGEEALVAYKIKKPVLKRAPAIKPQPSPYQQPAPKPAPKPATLTLTKEQELAATLAQGGVYSPGAKSALFAELHIKPAACDNKSHAARSASLIIRAVNEFVEQYKCHDSITVVFGFGETFWRQLTGNANKPKSFNFRGWKLDNKSFSIPATGGDIFIFAKADKYEQVRALQRVIHQAANEVASKKLFEIGFDHDGRDLSGFVDGTENIHTRNGRVANSLNPDGGAFFVAQRWVHDFDALNTTEQKIQEAWIGRTKPASIELEPKPRGAHIERVETHDGDGAENSDSLRLEVDNGQNIYRQSMPYRDYRRGEMGLFFIAFAKSVSRFDRLFIRMSEPNNNDLLFLFTRPVTGNYYYAPPAAFLNSLLETENKKY